jgi:hypothetical protein
MGKSPKIELIKIEGLGPRFLSEKIQKILTFAYWEDW